MKAPLYLIAAILSVGLACFSKSELSEITGIASFIFFVISGTGVIMSWIIDAINN